MPVLFSLDGDNWLTWDLADDDERYVSESEAAIIASARQAWALNSIAQSLDQIAEEIRDASLRVAKERD